jgi:hypothetical protein
MSSEGRQRPGGNPGGGGGGGNDGVVTADQPLKEKSGSKAPILERLQSKVERGVEKSHQRLANWHDALSHKIDKMKQSDKWKAAVANVKRALQTTTTSSSPSQSPSSPSQQKQKYNDSPDSAPVVCFAARENERTRDELVDVVFFRFRMTSDDF